ncbi:MAG: DUF885 domain-containing protein [bacterium]
MLLIFTSSLFAGTLNSDSDFEQLANDFVEEYLMKSPETGTYLGLHQYDGKVSDYSIDAVNRDIKWLRSYETRIESFDPSQLTQKNYINYKILLNEIKKDLFSYEVRQGYKRNPMSYAGSIDVNIYVSRDFAPIEERVRSIIKIEKNAPLIFSEARKNLVDALPKTFVETAISIAKGSADFLGNDLIIALKDVNNQALMKEFNEANTAAMKELNEFASYLETEKLPKATNDFALGCENYKRMLKDGEFLDYSVDEILEIGLDHLKKEQQLFKETAAIIDPGKSPIEVFKEIQKDHPTAQTLISDAKNNMESIRQFLIDKQIITIPSEVRALVTETPQYARASTFASMNTPGPFEKSTQAYYYITPVDDNWSDKQKEEWLTAFNYYTTDIVSIHEAYPGHYVQFLHVNASDASKIQKIFGSYAFSEGWAHYTEQMMIDEGFGADKDKITAAKFKLAQIDESLLRYCRLCVSIMMHCKGMNVEDATKFFMDNCYYEEQPANSEAVRGTYDPGYLYYTLGKLMLFKLRDDYKLQEGENYSLRKFHDSVLKYGSPPIPLLREIILKDKSIHNDLF